MAASPVPERSYFQSCRRRAVPIRPRPSIPRVRPSAAHTQVSGPAAICVAAVSPPDFDPAVHRPRSPPLVSELPPLRRTIPRTRHGLLSSDRAGVGSSSPSDLRGVRHALDFNRDRRWFFLRSSPNPPCRAVPSTRLGLSRAPRRCGTSRPETCVASLTPVYFHGVSPLSSSPFPSPPDPAVPHTRRGRPGRPRTRGYQRPETCVSLPGALTSTGVSLLSSLPSPSSPSEPEPQQSTRRPSGHARMRNTPARLDAPLSLNLHGRVAAFGLPSPSSPSLPWPHRRMRRPRAQRRCRSPGDAWTAAVRPRTSTGLSRTRPSRCRAHRTDPHPTLKAARRAPRARVFAARRDLRAVRNAFYLDHRVGRPGFAVAELSAVAAATHSTDGDQERACVVAAGRDLDRGAGSRGLRPACRDSPFALPPGRRRRSPNMHLAAG